jgi:hypothetical protein
MSSPVRLLAAFATLIAALAIPAAAGATVVCPGTNAPTLTGATSADSTLNSMFTTYGNSGAGWTGGDSTYSARLPDGRNLWMFSDTFLPPITPPTRPTSAPIVHNTFVPQSGTTLSTITGGTTGSPTQLFSPATSSHWYWIGAGTVAGSNVEVPLLEWQSTGPGPWDIAWVANAVARVPTSNLHATPTITALPSSAGIEWGSWVSHEGANTYVYGVEDLGADKYMHIARVAGSSLTGTWKYYVGGDPSLASSWSSTESASIRVLDYVANEYSVHKLRNGLYMLLTMDTSAAFSAEMVGYFSCTPTGPFVARTTLYNTPETGPLGTYADSDVYTYNAHVHTELSTATKLVVSYNVNSLDTTIGGDVYRDVSIYRPRFVDVHLSN